MDKKIVDYIDHTLLKPDARENDILVLCNEAKTYSFHSVCVNPYFVPLAVKTLEGSGVKVCSVVDFPLGASLESPKGFEAKKASENGADEIDMVANISMIKAHNYQEVADQIETVRMAIGNDKILKVIIETCLLSDEEKTKCAQIIKGSGADFVKTSTGFSKYGATVEDVKLLRKAVGNDFGVKASGGIRDLATFKAMLDAGANRIGCSASVSIVKEAGI